LIKRIKHITQKIIESQDARYVITTDYFLIKLLSIRIWGKTHTHTHAHAHAHTHTHIYVCIYIYIYIYIYEIWDCVYCWL